MKLASQKHGRDGRLLIVRQDMAMAVPADDIAPTLQAALDDWDAVAPKLQKRYEALNEGTAADAYVFETHDLAAPLPRAYQWADGSAYVNHVELVRKARGAEMPESFWTDPLMYQGGSDRMIGPNDPIEIADADWGIDFEAEVAVITDDVPMGTSAEEAEGHIKLVMLVNDVSLRNLIPSEIGKGFGFFQSKPASAFSPVAVTPETLGDYWKNGTVQRSIVNRINGEEFGRPRAEVDMTFTFPQLIAHAAKTRHLGAGTIIGSGTISNVDRSAGSSCIAERRMLEIIEHGEAKTPFLQFGDTVSIEMYDNDRGSLFGAIHQEVVKYQKPEARNLKSEVA